MKIAILTSGGESAGMNTALCVLYKKLSKKHQIVLIERGYCGLVDFAVCDLTKQDIIANATVGGTIIKSGRCEQFKTKQGVQKAVENLKNNNIDLVIVLGGNGSLKGCKELCENNIKTMFIPCTIDNDVKNSEMCIGFCTATQNCINYIKNVDMSMQSFNRTGIYEIMGRHDNSIIDAVAKQVDCDFSFREKTDTFAKCVKAVKQTLKTKPCAMVLVRENLIDIQSLSETLTQKLGIECRVHIVGYIQRGGNPCKEDVMVATKFANECAKQILSKNFNKEIIVKSGKYIVIDL